MNLLDPPSLLFRQMRPLLATVTALPLAWPSVGTSYDTFAEGFLLTKER